MQHFGRQTFNTIITPTLAGMLIPGLLITQNVSAIAILKWLPIRRTNALLAKQPTHNGMLACCTSLTQPTHHYRLGERRHSRSLGLFTQDKPVIHLGRYGRTRQGSIGSKIDNENI